MSKICDSVHSFVDISSAFKKAVRLSANLERLMNNKTKQELITQQVI